MDLERAYADRPSRPEDIEHIALLERDVEMKEQLLQKAMVLSATASRRIT